MRRLLSWVIMIAAAFSSYEYWATDQTGMPKLFPSDHPIVGVWEDAAEDSPKEIAFGRNRHGTLFIQASDDRPLPTETGQSAEVDFNWLPRDETSVDDQGDMQLIFDRADYSGGGRDEMSPVCTYQITVSEASLEEAAVLVVEGNPRCGPFLGTYRQVVLEESEGTDL